MNTEKQRLTFISYSRDDKNFALALAKELRSSGFLVWLDQLDIPTGSRWDDEVEKALENCEIFMVILTPNSIASNNVKDEIGYAIDSNKQILPILLENAKVPFRLRRFQYVDFTSKNHDEGIEAAKQLLIKLGNNPTSTKLTNPAVVLRSEYQYKTNPDTDNVQPRTRQPGNYTNHPSGRKKTKMPNALSILFGLVLVGIIMIGTYKFINTFVKVTPVPLTPPLETSSTILPTNTFTPSATTTTTPYHEEIIGYSAGHKEIIVYKFGSGQQHIVLIGGLHAGFAPSTVLVAQNMKDYLLSNPNIVPNNVTLDIITTASPDSLPPIGYSYAGLLEGRLNLNKVDLNRNWDCDWKSQAIWRDVKVSGGTDSFSEPETIALRDFILQNEKTLAVVFWLARDNPPSVSPGGCGTSSNSSNSLAQIYGNAAGYTIKEFEAYTVTGDATNWLDSQGVASISVLMPSYTELGTAEFAANLDAVKRLLSYYGY